MVGLLGLLYRAFRFMTMQGASGRLLVFNGQSRSRKSYGALGEKVRFTKSVLRAATFHLRNKVCLEIIGWMMKTARSATTVRAYLQHGGASIIVVYAVSFSLSAKALIYS
jgi:hypothetical protein